MTSPSVPAMTTTSFNGAGTGLHAVQIAKDMGDEGELSVLLRSALTSRFTEKTASFVFAKKKSRKN